MNNTASVSILGLILLTSCGNTTGSDPFTGGGGGGSVGADGSAGSGGASTGGHAGGLLDAGPTGDGTLTPDQACAAEHVEAKKIPLDLYLMIDRSSSMSNEMPGTTQSFWDAQESALNAFFSDPQSADMSIALRFFPLDDGDQPQDAQCSGNAYAAPLLAWGELPGHAGVLATAIASTTPQGAFTPTEEALRGVLQGALARQTAEPNHVVAAVLVSDGRPCCVSNKCPANTALELGPIAAQYASGSPPIKTYAIYLAFEPFEVMETIAQQGETGAAYDATGGQQAFVDALNAIRNTVLACEYEMPTSSVGVVDPDRVEVEYAPGGTGTPQRIARLMNGSECVGSGGWHYDDNASPTKLVLCASTCLMIQSDPAAKLDILVGCAPVHR